MTKGLQNNDDCICKRTYDDRKHSVVVTNSIKLCFLNPMRLSQITTVKGSCLRNSLIVEKECYQVSNKKSDSC